MADRTPEFRKVVEDGIKAQKVPPTGRSSQVLLPEPVEPTALSKKRKKSDVQGGKKKSAVIRRDPLESKARAIEENVNRLRGFLQDNRGPYVDVLNSVCSPDALTDLDRNNIDAGANNFVATIKVLISKLKEDVKKTVAKAEAKEASPQRVEHLEAVMELLESRLRAACEVHARQKAIRAERELEAEKLSRLEIEARKHSSSSSSRSGGPAWKASRPSAAVVDKRSEFDEVRLLEAETRRPDEGLGPSFGAEGGDGGGGLRRRKGVQGEVQSRVAPDNLGSTGTYLYSEDDEAEGPLRPLSPEEQRTFQEENEAMYEDLMSLRDNVRQIENKVVKISELQEAFTEKVLQQKGDIDLISNNAVATTENLKDANEEIRKAIQRNASIRVYVLFFLIVMSFSLLFLDWYND